MSEASPLTPPVQRVAVLGAGVIGASWTALFLARGIDVDVYDPVSSVRRDVEDYVANAWPQLEALGLVAAAGSGRMEVHASAADAVREAGFVQENVPERIETKHAIYREIEPHLRPGTLVASSTSALMLKNLQTAFEDPSRIVIAHPFNPPHLIPLVELLANDSTAADAIARATAFYVACGKVCIELHKEVPGHVANRLQAALWREAVSLAVEGVASVGDIDDAIRYGPGLRWAVMGPSMLFHLAAGKAGIETFCERYGEMLHGLWDDLGAPRIDGHAIATLAAGVRDAQGDLGFEELAARRDARIVATLAALKGTR